jgi:hypothetical protein
VAPCGENVLGCVQDGHIDIQSNSLYINKSLPLGMLSITLSVKDTLNF